MIASDTPSWIANITDPATVATDRSWWEGRYGQWTLGTIRVKDIPASVLRFAKMAQKEGWTVALRAGNHAVDDWTSVGIWEVELTGRVRDNVTCGMGNAVLSVMWSKKEGGKRWMFDHHRSVAEISGRVLNGIVTLADYEKGARIARPVK